jgi:predicted metal-binding membrane protein
MRVHVNSRKPLVVVLAGLVILCWLALWAWGASPYGRFLSHEELAYIRLGDELRLGVLFVAGWTLMTIAMMLPTSLPLVVLFYGMMGQRSDRGRLIALLLAGYLGLWTLFGGVVHVADFVLHQVVERVAWLAANDWLISAGTLVLAGLYQFSPLKYKCLDKCRSPMSFITQHWRGRHAARQALRLGGHHALFCIGCCWALMLVMFAVGVGSILWMLGLGAVMAVEKNMPWGRRLAAPLGLVLITCGLSVVIRGLAGI